jgi:hypothetical protein
VRQQCLRGGEETDAAGRELRLQDCFFPIGRGGDSWCGAWCWSVHYLHGCCIKEEKVKTQMFQLSDTTEKYVVLGISTRSTLFAPVPWLRADVGEGRGREFDLASCMLSSV